jgi:S1-C subfamily serine protease
MLGRLLRFVAAVLPAATFAHAVIAHEPAEAEDTVARVKQSIVAVGTFQQARSPSFLFRATAFVVGDGTLVATNAHVLPDRVNLDRQEYLAILVPGPADQGGRLHVRRATVVVTDAAHDLAVLKIEGRALPAVRLGDSAQVREGRPVYFTGFPIGAVLGAYPVTHRGLVASISPIAIPQGNASDLNPRVLRRLSEGTFPIFQLDATAYPGNSGSPVYEAAGGAVIGIINMVMVRATKESLLTQPSGITYAIPAVHLRDLLASVR